MRVAAIGWLVSMMRARLTASSVAVSQAPSTISFVISSRQKAPKHGCGHLLVDGTDERVVRRVTFAFNPGRRQERLLLELLAVCCEVYNAGLEERREAWRRARSEVSVFDQFNQLSWLRHHRPDVFAF